MIFDYIWWNHITNIFDQYDCLTIDHVTCVVLYDNLVGMFNILVLVRTYLIDLNTITILVYLWLIINVYVDIYNEILVCLNVFNDIFVDSHDLESRT